VHTLENSLVITLACCSRGALTRASPLRLFHLDVLPVQVSGSSHFCGLAEMTSTAAAVVRTASAARGFTVKWHAVKDVPHRMFAHLRLSNGDGGRPVSQARDAQELPSSAGAEAVRVLVACPRSEFSVIDAFVQFAGSPRLRRASKSDGNGNGLQQGPARRRQLVPRRAGSGGRSNPRRQER
jgi:hypothetical protein